MHQIFPLLHHIEKNPTAIRLAQTFLGKLVIITLFVLIIHFTPLYPVSWQVTITLVLLFTSFFPQYRYLSLFVGMFSLMLNGMLIRISPDWYFFINLYIYSMYNDVIEIYSSTATMRYLNIFLMLVISECLIYCVRHYQNIKLFRYPITVSYLFVYLLIGMAAYAHLEQTSKMYLWSFILVYVHYFWFIAYTLQEAKLGEQRDFLLTYARYLPIWGYTLIPYGKGSIYLKHVEAKTPEELAIIQIKALKLAFWALLIYFLYAYVTHLQKTWQIPNLQTALLDYANGKRYTPLTGWIFLIFRFYIQLLGLCYTGHLVISTCRMCGFGVLRNTYKPLASVTIAEFWGRYNYYFKELLVEFFFYPTYFRYFRQSPKWRIFFATISAATFGNIIFHSMILPVTILSEGLNKTLTGFVPFMFYAIILGLAIAFSQLRHLTTRPVSRWNRFVISPLVIIVFYSLLELFNDIHQPVSILINFKILASLFGL